ncbi:hypothetical protein QLQ12_46355 [Actinoplanes sp. NEAU-A12]|uniref:Core-binding (CB) domain-containing protein n=1 Tax=Actinoplanes sandaracinus TaxID=3045177 RepID=A0ABT6X1Y5_9ACTN|nr:hypothetical protein [Actinoplanes sandaracinus]MDI6106013.1 hypothetical protein [Actinoplanes sandaracinus]
MSIRERRIATLRSVSSVRKATQPRPLPQGVTTGTLLVPESPIRPCRFSQHDAMGHADPRTTRRYDRGALPRPPDPQAVENLTALLLEHATPARLEREHHPQGPQRHECPARPARHARSPIQDRPPARPSHAGPATRLLREFLDGIGFLEDDLTPALELWFTRKVTDLPAPMQAELRVWFDVTFHGHKASAPRSRAPTQPTIRARLNAVLPVLHQWAETAANPRARSRSLS